MREPRPRRRSDGSTYWQVPFRLAGKQTSESFDDRKVALRFARLLDSVGPEQARKVIRESRGRRGASVPTLAEWVEHYLDHASGVAVGTRWEYRKLAARSWVPDLGSWPVDVISRDQVRRWVQDYAASGRSAKTVENAHGLLSTVLASAVEAGHRPDNPAKGVKIPKGLRDEMVFLTPGEFARLLHEIPEQWHPLVLTFAGTGARWSEVTALTWGSVDLDSPVPSIRITQAWKKGERGQRHLGTPKTERSRRTVSLPPEVVAALVPRQGKPDELVFRAQRGGRIHPQWWRPNVWVPAVERADLGKRPRIHDLRHSHASWLIAQGVPLPEIQNRLGHEDISTTVGTYGHLLPDSHRRTALAASLALTNAMPELEG